MKTVRVFVLVLLASFHVFTPVSTNDAVPTGNKTSTAPSATTSASSTKAPGIGSTGAPNAATPAAATATTTTTTATTTATAAAATTAATTTPTSVSTTAPSGATSKTPETKNATVSTPAPMLKTVSMTAAPINNSVTATSATSPTPMDNNSSINGLQPRSHHQPDQGNQSHIGTTEPQGTTLSTVRTGNDAISMTAAPAAHQTVAATQKPKQDAGSQTGSEEKVPPKSDKRLWWTLLPALLVGAAAAIVLKYKCKKIHDHSETIDSGTENASFQNRPECTKDGVMLLGVKSSGGEDNVAGR